MTPLSIMMRKWGKHMKKHPSPTVVTGPKPVVFLAEDGSYMTEDQILADLPKRITDPADLALIRNNFEADPSEPSAIMCEEIGINLGGYVASSLGRWMRNSYGMWHPENPHIVLNPAPNAEGIIDHPRFPDNLSGEIIKRFVASLQ